MSGACSHVECSKLTRVNCIDDSNTTHGFVTGDGRFPVRGETLGKVFNEAESRHYMIPFIWGP